MTDNITLIGFVATPPKHFVTGEGLPITSFRLASTQRRFDRAQGRWADGETNWYTITAFRQLAMNAVSSVNKGDRVMVSGRLRIRGWEAGDRSGTNIDVEADAVGHDLSWGTSAFTRNVITTPAASLQEGAGSNGIEQAGAEQADREPNDGEPTDDEHTAREERFPSAASLGSDEMVDSNAVAVPF
ncbi:MAG: single-stranded DNA-binding protein [Lacisediminihabitans sp.]